MCLVIRNFFKGSSRSSSWLWADFLSWFLTMVVNAAAPCCALCASLWPKGSWYAADGPFVSLSKCCWLPYRSFQLHWRSKLNVWKQQSGSTAYVVIHTAPKSSDSSSLIVYEARSHRSITPPEVHYTNIMQDSWTLAASPRVLLVTYSYQNNM